MIPEHLIHLRLLRHLRRRSRIIKRHIDDGAVAHELPPDELRLWAPTRKGGENRFAVVPELVGMVAKGLHHVAGLLRGQSGGIVGRDKELEVGAQFLGGLVEKQRPLFVVRFAPRPSPAVQREAVQARGLGSADLALVVLDLRASAIGRNTDHVVRKDSSCGLVGRSRQTQPRHGQCQPSTK